MKNKVPQLIALIHQNLTVSEIVEQIGCTRANVYATAKRYNLQLQQTRRSKFGPEEKAKMRKLKLNGLTCEEIAQKYNCSKSTVKEITKGSGQKYRNQYSVDSFDSESHARDMINNYLKSRDIVYAGNYTGCDNPVDLRCGKCGTVFTRSMCTVRKNKVHCPECADKANKEMAKKREAEQIAKIERIRQRAEAKKQRDLARIEKLKAKEHPCFVCGCITKNKCYCSRRCAKKAENKYRDKRIKRNQIIDKDISLEKLFKRDNGICYICGLKCNYEDYVMRGDVFIAGDYYPSIEHVKPISKGGKHSWDNIKLAHRKCNTFKGVNTLVV